MNYLNQNRVRFIIEILLKYLEGLVLRLIKSITGREVFKEAPEIKKASWGGEFCMDGYFFTTVKGMGKKKVVEKYIQGQGKIDNIKQLRLFE